MTLENNNMAHTERGSALLALRARTLAKFGEVDTVPVRENNPFKIEKKYKNIRKKVFKKSTKPGTSPKQTGLKRTTYTTELVRRIESSSLKTKFILLM